MADCAVHFPQAPNGSKLATIVEKCLSIRWNQSSPAIRTLAPAGPSLDGIMVQMEEMWESAAAAVAARRASATRTRHRSSRKDLNEGERVSPSFFLVSSDHHGRRWRA